MKAYWFEKAGSARDVLQFGEQPVPEPGPGDVRVKVASSAVNPTDCKRRQTGRELGRFPLIVPNNDGSGVIEAVGDGVDAGRVGERVWLFAAQAGRPHGTAAEYCTVPAGYARPLPDNQSYDDGACLGVPAVTAHRALFADGDIAGKTLLVTGGAGRVGRYIVQMAKRAGATVIATAGSPEKVEHMRALGADHPLDYRRDDVIAAVGDITDGVGVDRMIDVAFANNIASAPTLVRANGIVTSYSSDADPSPSVPFIELMYKNILVRPFSIMGMPDAAKEAAFSAIDAMLEDGALTHLVGARYAFSEMVEAQEAIDEGSLFGVCVVGVNDSL